MVRGQDDDATTAGVLGYLSGSPRVSLGPDVETSGARAHVLGTIGGFESLGWQVERFIAGDDLPRSVSAPGSHGSVAGSSFRRLAADGARWLLGRANGYRAYRRLGRRVDLVYERLGMFQQLGAAFVSRGIPWVLETNGLLFKEAHETRKTTALPGLARKLEIEAYRRCSALVCVSTALRDLVVEASGIDPGKVIVSRNAVDTVRFDPAAHGCKRVGRGFVVGVVGNLYEWSGIDLLLRAVAALRRRGKDVDVVIVGDGMAREDLQEEARRLGISEHAHFVGRVPWDEVPEYLNGFDLAFSGQTSSILGGDYRSPLKLYEYMAMGRPVISASSEDARIVITPGETGLTYRPDDLEHLTVQLEQAICMGPKLEGLGVKARDLIVREHSWTSRIGTLIERLEPVLNEPHV